MFRGMEYVYAVYQERSFSKAAQRLFISQPSLSASVRRVEERLGCPIFDRATKPLGLTDCGKRYIQAVEQIMSVENGFAAYLDDLTVLQAGELALGGSSFFSAWVLPPLIRSFSQAFPNVKISLLETRTTALPQALQSGQVDLMLDNCDLDRAAFDRRVFREEHLLLAVPRRLEINNSLVAFQVPASRIRDGSFLAPDVPVVPLDAFSGQPFVFMQSQNDTGKRAALICQEQGLKPRILFELDQQMTSYNVTCSGIGISFLGDLLISQVPVDPQVVYYRLGGRYSRRSIYFYWMRGRYMTKAMVEFLARAAANR